MERYFEKASIIQAWGDLSHHYMDVKTGAPCFEKTQQGYSDTSCWARGQGGICGFPLSYGHTGGKAFLTYA